MHRVIENYPKPQSNVIRRQGDSLAWPDPIFAQGRYRFQYKRPARGAYTESDNAPARK